MSIDKANEALNRLRDGTFPDQFGKLLAETVKRVDETGNPGNITITFNVKKSEGAIFISAKYVNDTP